MTSFTAEIKRHSLRKITPVKGCYLFLNELNEVIYVGSTLHFYRRFAEHQSYLINRQDLELYKYCQVHNVYTILIPCEDYRVFEGELINYYQPLFNKVKVLNYLNDDERKEYISHRNKIKCREYIARDDVKKHRQEYNNRKCKHPLTGKITSFHYIIQYFSKHKDILKQLGYIKAVDLANNCLI